MTRFQFRLHPVDAIVGGMLFLPATPETIAGFIAAADTAADELTTIANFMLRAADALHLPEAHHGQLIIFAYAMRATGKQANVPWLLPFTAAPIADMVRPMCYPEMYLPEEPDYHPRAVARTMFLNTVNRDVAQRIVDYLEASNAPVLLR